MRMKPRCALPGPAAFVVFLLGCAGAPTNARPIDNTVVISDDCRHDVRIELPWHTDVGTPSPDSSFVRVRVSELGDLRRVAGVRVHVLDRGIPVAAAVTDPSGEARLRVKAGRYRIEFRSLGYQLTFTEVVLNPAWSVFAEVPIWVHPLC